MLRWKRSHWLAACALIAALAAALLLLRILCPPPARARANTLWVKSDGAGDVCSQDSACRLATALSLAENGDTINLAGGIYFGPDEAVVRLDKDLTLRGGWDGARFGTPVFDPLLYSSILDGQNERRVVELTPGVSVVLQDLNVEHGSRPDEGAGIFSLDASLTLVNVQVYHNTIAAALAEVRGAGMAVYGGDLHIERGYFEGNAAVCADCLSMGGGLYVEDAISTTLLQTNFIYNDALMGAAVCARSSGWTRAPLFVDGSTFEHNGRQLSHPGAQLCSRGGAIVLRDADAHIGRCGFLENHAGDWGGALDATGLLRVDRCAFSGNMAQSGAAVAIAESSVLTMTNSFLGDNFPEAEEGGGCVLIAVESSAWLLHNTIVRSRSQYQYPHYGVTIVEGSHAEIVDDIIASHSVGIWADGSSHAWCQATLFGADAWANDSDVGGDGVIERVDPELFADPAFANPEAGNWHLLEGSPAIDAGVDCNVDHDYDGEPRPMGAGFDIGADEYFAALPTPTATASLTPTATSTATPTATRSRTPTASPSATSSPSPTSTATRTATPTGTATRTPSPTATLPAPTLTATPTRTATRTPSPTATLPAPTATATPSASPPARTATRTASPTATLPAATRTGTPSPTATPTRTLIPGPTPAAMLAAPGLYFCDTSDRPGQVRHYEPWSGAERVVYTRPRDTLSSFSLAAWPERLYYVNWNDTRILAASRVGGLWQGEETLYTHSTYVRDLAVTLEPGGAPSIYFSEFGASGGRIYRYAQGAASLYYEVSAQDVPAWTGEFCFGADGDLYLSQGNMIGASLFRLRAGQVQRIYQSPDGAIMGVCYLPGRIYYADHHQRIYRLDLATLARTLVYTCPTCQSLTGVQWLGQAVYLPAIKRSSN